MSKLVRLLVAAAAAAALAAPVASADVYSKPGDVYSKPGDVYRPGDVMRSSKTWIVHRRPTGAIWGDSLRARLVYGIGYDVR